LQGDLPNRPAFLKEQSMNYRGKFILFILAAMLLLAACGEADPTPTSVPEPTDTAVPPTATPKPTEEPTATSTPLSAGVPEPTDTPEAEPTEEPAAEMPDNLAPIVNDEGGVVSITGVVTYTNPFFTLGVAAPLVITEDQAGFVERDENYIFPVESQTLGQITSDFSESPFSYSLTLPIEPKGAYKDVDNDGEEDLGVQVFAIAYWNNTFGDPFLEERDLGGGGWSTAYASTRISDEVETEREIVGGKLLVYAPDDQQGFPGGFGEDGLLFTEDDPIVILPPGYTVVDLDSDPFTFDRAREQVIDLIEPEGAALVDYSELSYTEAFDALVDQLKNEYAFTEYKGIDWEALREEFRPEFEAADEAKDADRYLNALGRFALAIPDGHVSGPFLRDAFREAILGGIGLAVKELDDGRVLAVFLTEGGLAEQAGIEIGAEILEVNGAPISEHIGSVPLFQSFSADHARRLEQVTYAMRFPLDTEVELVYQNPGAAAAQTVRMTADFDPDSYNFWLEEDGRDGFELPVEFEVLDEGIGYVRIYSFSDNDLLTAQLWERMIQEMNDNDIPAIIVDMRQNGGGRGSLADNLAAYFFNEEFVLGNVAAYDKDRGEFYIDPDHEDKFILPPDEDLRYDGDVVVLVGPSCASACEFFSFDMTIDDRATIIGQYPTAGLGGSVDEVAMPEDEQFRFTQGRALGPDGEIHIEGIGVVPDIDVPVDEASVLGDEDVVLQAAIRFLLGEPVDAGEIALGETATGAVRAKEPVRYTLTLGTDDVFSMLLTSETDDANLILRVLDTDGNELAATDPDMIVGYENVALGEPIVLVLEVATADGVSEADYSLAIINEG